MTEGELKNTVIAMCRALHLLVAHFRPGKTEKGWRTPVEGDGAGFPDCVIVGPGGLLFVELKADGKYPTVQQRTWLNALSDAGSPWAIWRPRDLRQREIERRLKQLAKPGREVA